MNSRKNVVREIMSCQTTEMIRPRRNNFNLVPSFLQSQSVNNYYILFLIYLLCNPSIHMQCFNFKYMLFIYYIRFLLSFFIFNFKVIHCMINYLVSSFNFYLVSTFDVALHPEVPPFICIY